MSPSLTRIRAVVGKELREYRRNRFILTTMALLPIAFITAPTIQLFATPATVSSPALERRLGLTLLYLLLVPAILPATLAGYAVVGEREQGTLEPVLTTPVRREEFLLGKAVAALAPTLAIAYAMYGIFLTCAALFAHDPMRSAVFQTSHVVIQVCFTPLVAVWSIWAGIAVSTRANDVRVAQQLSVLSSLPPLALTALLTLNVIPATVTVGLIIAAGLVLIDLLGWRIVAGMFDRERLITSTRS